MTRQVGDSGCPQENPSQLRHDDVDLLAPPCKRRCRHHEGQLAVRREEHVEAARATVRSTLMTP